MKKHAVALIEGDFSPEQTKKLLVQLLTHKINYHSFNKFSNEERFGHDHTHAEQRISSLMHEKQQLIEWLNALSSDQALHISCQINLQTLP